MLQMDYSEKARLNDVHAMAPLATNLNLEILTTKMTTCSFEKEALLLRKGSLL